MRRLLIIVLIATFLPLHVQPLAQEAQRADWQEWRRCTGGDVSKCAEVGQAYAKGAGRPKDIVLATVFLTLACDSGGQACFPLGQLYGSGEGYSRDDARRVARSWQNCAAKVAQACFEMGEFYRTAKIGGRMTNATWELQQILRLVGRGATAEELETTCETGRSTNCTKRAAMSYLGQSVPVDLATALKFLDRACTSGDRTGCKLATTVRDEQDTRGRYLQSAEEWYNLAIAMDPDNQPSKLALKALAK